MLIHLAFVITMFTINTDVTINLQYDGPKREPTTTEEEAHRLLAGAVPAKDVEKPDPMSIKEHELEIFKALLVAHCCIFVLQNVILALKYFLWDNTA